MLIVVVMVKIEKRGGKAEVGKMHVLERALVRDETRFSGMDENE